MVNPIMRDLQSLQPSALVELFVLDMSSFGAGIVYFHPGTNGLTQALIWQGQVYHPFPVKAEGFECNGKGSLPKPTLTVSNTEGMISALVMDHDDLVGAKVIRKRTYARYLDADNFGEAGNAQANALAGFDDDVWWVNQKTSETKLAVVFELASILDVTGINLPGRQIIANCCAWKYRSWNGVALDYTQVSCPYTGAAMFDLNDQPVTHGAQDQCSGKLTGCAVRYGASPMPYGGFPASRRFTS